MTLLAEVVGRLDEKHVAHCLIGAAALALHGAPRSTQDDDILVLDAAVLEPGFWGPLEDAVVRRLRGDADDPLAGGVRLRRAGDRDVDVIVGRWTWQRDAVERASMGSLPDGAVRVAEAADLVLLKLDAGGPQDLSDVEVLLDLGGPGLVETVERRLESAHRALREEWGRVRARSRPR